MVINKRKFNAECKKRISFRAAFFMLFMFFAPISYWVYVFTTSKFSNVGNSIKVLSLAIVAMSGYVAYLVWKYRVNKKTREMGEDMWETIFRVEGVFASATFFPVYSMLALLTSKVIGGIIFPVPPRKSDEFLMIESDLETFFLWSVLISVVFVAVIYLLGVFLRYRK